MIDIIQRAILNNETEFNGIELPTRQTSGTDRQIVSYALIQAREFILNNNL